MCLEVKKMVQRTFESFNIHNVIEIITNINNGILDINEVDPAIITFFDYKINWYFVCCEHKLSEDFIRLYVDKLDDFWSVICWKQNLSEGFIKEFQDKVNWLNVCSYQNLSEYFIREFIYDVDWYGISKHQKISEEFIREFAYKINWSIILFNKNVSENFIINSWNLIIKHIKKYRGINFLQEYYSEIEEDDYYSDEFCSFIYDYLQKEKEKNKLINIFETNKEKETK
jgi:hypothetical protein